MRVALLPALDWMMSPSAYEMKTLGMVIWCSVDGKTLH